MEIVQGIPMYPATCFLWDGLHLVASIQGTQTEGLGDAVSVERLTRTKHRSE